MKKLKALVEALGATIHDNSTPKVYDYGIEAPQGYIWAVSCTHELVMNWYKGNQAWNAGPIQDAIERVQLGIVPCDDENCEWCDRNQA